MSYSNNATINTSFSVSHFVGLIIGPKGATIKALKSKYQLKKCFIKNDILHLSGPAAGCTAVKREVLALIEEKRIQNRQQMDRYAMVAGANLQRKRQLQAKRKREQEAKLAARVQAGLESKEEPTYIYKGKFNIDSDSEEEKVSVTFNRPTVSKARPAQGSWAKPLKVEESEEPKVTKMVAPMKPKKVELNRHRKKRWADICDEESDDESDDEL